MATDDIPFGERMKDRIDRISLFQGILIFTVVCTIVSLLYWGGHHFYLLYWARAFLDWFWNVYDYSIERMRVLAALVPLILAFIAYRVYRADQWWKRAEWALDASVDEHEDRSLLGKKAITLLGGMNLAPPKDKRLFSTLTAEERNNDILDEMEGDPAAQEEASRIRAEDPGSTTPVPPMVDGGVDGDERPRR